MPQPADDTSLEQIVQFKSDADSQHKAAAFQNWLEKLMNRNATPKESIQEFRELKYQYEAHMKFHKMKVNYAAVESFVTCLADVPKNLVLFKWGNIAKLPFILSHRTMELLEAELEAPGREVDLRRESRSTQADATGKGAITLLAPDRVVGVDALFLAGLGG